MKNLILSLTIIGLFLVGCSTEMQTSNQETPKEGSENVVENSPTNKEVAPSENAATSKITDELETFLEKQFTAEFGVVYKLTTIAPDAAEPYTYANYVSGPNKIRFDTVMPEMETRSYMVGDTTTNCNKFEGEWICTESKASKEDLEFMESDQAIDTDLVENTDPSKVSRAPDRTILNTKTSCYQITMEDGKIEYCFTSEGIPLYMEVVTTDYEGVTYTQISEATSFMKSVPNSMFVPPAEPIE